MKRSLGFAVIGVCILALAGCSSSRQRMVADEKDIQTERGQEVEGYTTTDALYHPFKGYVRSSAPDTLEFFTKERKSYRTEQYPKSSRIVRIQVPRDSVQTIRAIHGDAGKTVFRVVATTVLVAGALAVVAVATSCPFLYSYDGERYVFDGEPYGGATMRGLERPDWSELEHLASVRGTYRLLITNEVDETQHTNSLGLLVVDHPPGTAVVMDKEGHPHAFRQLASLRAATDETGRDLRAWLGSSDNAVWSPDLRAYARADTLADTRNHITLEFPRPPGVDRAYLVANVATHMWGAQMIRTMLGMRGNRLNEFYETINRSDLARRQLLAWDEREELFELFPEVECGPRWERQDFIPAGGPFHSETRAIPLDLRHVEGNTLRIRIHPPIGYWSLNSFQLAWEESKVDPIALLPQSAGAFGSVDVAAVLGADDERYLDYPTPGDRAEVVFTAPPARKDMERTVFARTRGWYQVHLHGHEGDPDIAGLYRLTNEPGYAVRCSLREFREYERTSAMSSGGGEPSPW